MSVIASYIGLPTKDINLLKSLFKMLEGSSRAPIDIKFVDFNQYVSSEKMPDILFVNLDVPRALELWKDIRTNFPMTVAVFVTSYTVQDANNQHILKRPISLRQIISTLHIIANLNKEKNYFEVQGTDEASTGHKFNVLVVDDSFPVRKYMEHTLPRLVMEEMHIEYATDGHEAIAMTAVKHYNLIFLDVVMPGIDGYKVCKFVKKKHKSYIVLLTSKKSPFDKVRGTMSGCDAYVVKPPKEEKLKKIVTNCLIKNNSSYIHSNDGLTYKF